MIAAPSFSVSEPQLVAIAEHEIHPIQVTSPTNQLAEVSQDQQFTSAQLPTVMTTQSYVLPSFASHAMPFALPGLNSSVPIAPLSPMLSSINVSERLTGFSRPAEYATTSVPTVVSTSLTASAAYGSQMYTPRAGSYLHSLRTPSYLPPTQYIQGTNGQYIASNPVMLSGQYYSTGSNYGSNYYQMPSNGSYVPSFFGVDSFGFSSESFAAQCMALSAVKEEEDKLKKETIEEQEIKDEEADLQQENIDSGNVWKFLEKPPVFSPRPETRESQSLSPEKKNGGWLQKLRGAFTCLPQGTRHQRQLTPAHRF